jgi:ligand-binding sensor domain-containing protein
VAAFAESDGGAIWAATDGGLYRLVGDRWERSTVDSGPPNEAISTAYTDDRGRLFVTTKAGVFLLNQEQKTFHQIDTTGTVPAVSEDRFGTLWLADPFVGFRALSPPKAIARPGEQGWGVRLLHDHVGNLWGAVQGQG